jgi:hypothetical protein
LVPAELIVTAYLLPALKMSGPPLMVSVPIDPPGASVPPLSIVTAPTTVPWPDSAPAVVDVHGAGQRRGGVGGIADLQVAAADRDAGGAVGAVENDGARGDVDLVDPCKVRTWTGLAGASNLDSGRR